MDPISDKLVRFNPVTNEVIDARTNKVVRSLTPRKGEGYNEENENEIGTYTPVDDVGNYAEASVIVDNSYFQSVNERLYKIFERIDALTAGNTVLSPISIYMAFAILAEGVSGVSKQEVFEFFNFDPSEVVPPQELAYLLKLFDSSTENCQLLQANSAWVNDKILIATEYVDHITDKYTAKVESVSMTDSNTVGIINDWVEEQTGDMIKKVISTVEPTTMLMLINCVYFRGLWVEKFYPVEKDDEDFDGMFHSGEGEQCEADFMRSYEKYLYLGTEDSQYVVLPYQDTSIRMVIFLPNEGYDPQAGLDLDNVVQVAKIGSEAKVELIMPKFRMRTKMDLRDILGGLGCSKIFDPKQNTDFKDIFEGEGYISKMIHEAVIEVDEEGTTAAGTTAFEVGITSVEEIENVSVVVDRPFSFFLVDSDSSLILFAGVFRRPE